MVDDMPNRTLTLGQRTKDKVARDILRDEAQLPPPMRDMGLSQRIGPLVADELTKRNPLNALNRNLRLIGGAWKNRPRYSEEMVRNPQVFEGATKEQRQQILGMMGDVGRGLGSIARKGGRRTLDDIKGVAHHAKTLLPGGEKPDWRQILIGDIGRASGGIIGLNSGGRIPGYFEGGAWGGGGGWQGGQQQQGGGWGTSGGGMGLKPLGQPSPGTQWGAAGGGSRSDPFLGNPQGFAQFQAQQGGGGGQQQSSSGLSQPGVWQGGQQQQGAQPVLNAPGTGPGYQAQALPENYGAPAQYAGYGGPAELQSRQEFVSPEVAQQYADLTQGIMQVGTKPYERYQGPQLAGFTDMEAAAQAGYGAYGTGAGPQGTIQAQSTMDQAAGGMGSMVPKYQTLGTKYETAGTGIKTLADKAAEAQRGYSTKAHGLGQATEKLQREYGRTADTATATSLGLQRETGLEDYATQSALDQRALGTKLGAPELQKGADLSGYMSQYTQGVTDPQLQQLMEFQKMQGQELGSQAAGAGAFGSLRQGVQAATQAQDVSRQAADIIGKSQQEAFQSAQAAQAADVARTQAGQQAELGAERGALAAETGQQATQLSAEQQALQQQMRQEQFGAGQEQAAYQARMDAEKFRLSTEQAAHQAAMGGRQANLTAMKAQQNVMGDEMGAYKGIAGIGRNQLTLGQQQQSQQMQRLAAMKQAGASQRQLQQAALDIQKQQWEQQQQQPERQIAWMNQQLGTLPYQNIVQQGTYAPQAGAVSNLLGAGIQGAGLWNAWQGRQNRGATGPVNPDGTPIGITLPATGLPATNNPVDFSRPNPFRPAPPG